MKRLLKLVKFVSFVLLSVFLMIAMANHVIEENAKSKTFSETSEVKKNKVGLVLGTSKRMRNGTVNLYFKYRIDAVVELLNQGKIDFILVSGDNGTQYYDEPNDFKKELIERGVPENVIFLDHAGFRTLDSVIRAKKVFGQQELTIISQKFHVERAIYLAEKNGIKAIGFNAKDVSNSYGFNVKLREYLARTKVFIDLLLNVQPKFLGEKIKIE